MKAWRPSLRPRRLALEETTGMGRANDAVIEESQSIMGKKRIANAATQASKKLTRLGRRLSLALAWHWFEFTRVSFGNQLRELYVSHPETGIPLGPIHRDRFPPRHQRLAPEVVDFSRSKRDSGKPSLENGLHSGGAEGLANS